MLHLYQCPHCGATVDVCTRDATVGHRCFANRNRWTTWATPPTEQETR